jgi:hypothetical protein
MAYNLIFKNQIFKGSIAYSTHTSMHPRICIADLMVDSLL